MKAILMCLLFGMNVCVAWGQRTPGRSVRAAPIPPHEQLAPEKILISFLEVAGGSPVHRLGPDESVLVLGSVSNSPHGDAGGIEVQPQKDSLMVSTRFGIRIGLANERHAGARTLSAFLVSPNPLRIVWVDGVRLSATPSVIERQVSYGGVTEHLLRILIPVSAPAGQWLDSIVVVVTPD